MLTPRANARGLQTDLGAQLTGAGDLAIEAAGQVVTLSNGGNNYTGDTLVRSGTLQMANDNVLGATGNLNVASNAVFRTNGYSQTVGALQTETGAHIQLDSGSVLTVSGTQRQPGMIMVASLKTTCCPVRNAGCHGQQSDGTWHQYRVYR